MIPSNKQFPTYGARGTAEKGIQGTMKNHDSTEHFQKTERLQGRRTDSSNVSVDHGGKAEGVKV